MSKEQDKLDENERMAMAYNKGVIEGKKHSTPSPITTEKFSKINASFLTKDGFRNEQKDCHKANIKPIMDEIKELKSDFKGFGKEFNTFKAELKEIVAVIPYKVHESIMEEADRKYASKLTQKLVYGLVSIFLIAIATGVTALIIK